jgi:RNA-directed DNA polymerase
MRKTKDTTRLAQVRTMRSLGRAWRVIHDNGRLSQSDETRQEIKVFANDAETHLTRISRQLSRNAFNFGQSKGIPVLKSDGRTYRPLVKSPVESRIVQRAIHDVLLDVPAIRQFAETPYSFGGVRKTNGAKYAAVPAAIRAVVDGVAAGLPCVVKSDISAFFTRVPKPTVTKIVSDAVPELAFMDLFGQAITVELSNLAELTRPTDLFPIYEIGVAQGNCLSPLLGNLLLYDFDRGPCRPRKPSSAQSDRVSISWGFRSKTGPSPPAKARAYA